MDESNVIEFDEMIVGTANDDELIGTVGIDYIKGDTGNDWLNGGDGVDLLNGSSNNAVGIGEIDVLTGGGGRDLFLLGDSIDGIGHVPFYAGLGDNDFAVITDFTVGEDVIFLAGTAADYRLGSISNDSMNATGIYWADELIGVVAGTTPSDFTDTSFAFSMG